MARYYVQRLFKPTNIMTRCIAFIHIQFPSVALAVKTVRVVSLTSAYFTVTGVDRPCWPQTTFNLHRDTVRVR